MASSGVTSSSSSLGAAEEAGDGRESIGALSSIGDTKSTKQARTYAMKNFVKFLVYQRDHWEGKYKDWPIVAKDLTSEQANDQRLFERYAYWNVNECTKAGGGDLALGSMVDYVRSMGQQLMQLFGDDSARNLLSRLFTSNNWLSGITANMISKVAERAFAEGSEVRER